MAQVRESINTPVIRRHMEYEVLPVWILIFCFISTMLVQFPGALPNPFQERENVRLLDAQISRKKSRKCRKHHAKKLVVIPDTIPEESESNGENASVSESQINHHATMNIVRNPGHAVVNTIINLDSVYDNLRSIIDSNQDFTKDFLEIYNSSVCDAAAVKDFYGIERERGYLLVQSMRKRKKEITKFLLEHSSQPCLQKCLTFSYKGKYLLSLLLSQVKNVNFTLNSEGEKYFIEYLVGELAFDAVLPVLAHLSFDPTTVPMLLPLLMKAGAPLELFEFACGKFTNHAVDQVKGLNVLHMAIVSNRIDYLRIILSKLPQISINEQVDLFRSAPIHIAIVNGNPEILKLIMSTEGIDLNASNAIYDSPLELAEAILSNGVNYLNELVSREDRLACLELLKEALEAKK